MLEGIHENAVIIDSSAGLGQLEGGGVFIKITVELVYAKRIDSLVGLVLDVLQNEGFFKGFA